MDKYQAELKASREQYNTVFDETTIFIHYRSGI